MRYFIILALWLLATANCNAQDKVGGLDQSFLKDMKLVDATRDSLAKDSLVVVKFFKPVKSRDKYKFDLYRVEEYYAPTETPENLKQRKIMAGTHILVTLNSGIAATDIGKVFPESMVDKPVRIPNTDTYIVPVKNARGKDVQKSLKSFSETNNALKTQFDRAVKGVEYDYVVFVDLVPNDPDFKQLWGLHNTGLNGGTTDADIDATEAWDKTKGNSDLVIGIIDTGIDYKHPDLAANMWENSAEVNGVKNVDDDNNGYVDDFCGWNFYADNNNPRDDNMHGTHVAGTIGAIGDNGKGVSGVSWKVKMVALKFLSAYGWGNVSDAIEAVGYASGVPNMIATNNSWGGGGFSQALKDAIDKAAQHDILFIAAAGNEGKNNDVSPSYPANYDCPNIISVAATDRNDKLAYFSNYGQKTVHIGAPGVDIYSTVLKKKYDVLSGTSMATPHVTGVCVLVKSMFPTLSMQQVKNKILTMSDPKPSLSTKTSTGCRLNANGAMSATAAIK
jgi:subtilisin family serine protease